MSASTLLATLNARGIKLSVAGDQLEIEAPKKVITADDLATLRRCKAELLSYLSCQIQPDPPIDRPGESWQLQISALPIPWFSRWRAISGELQADLGPGRRTVEEIRSADRQAFDLVMVEIDQADALDWQEQLADPALAERYHAELRNQATPQPTP